MSSVQRGCLVGLLLLVIMAVCGGVTFLLLPSIGAGGALPVIVVPGEPYLEGWPSEAFYWTNTLSHTVIVTGLIAVIVWLGWRVSKGWTKEVPGRFQSVVELLGDFVYGQTKNFAGMRPLARNWLYPLAATIFLFLLLANLTKLIPGVESVGVIHCAGHNAPEIGISIMSGHPMLGSQMYIPSPLQSAYAATEEDYHHCKDYKAGLIAKPEKAALEAAAERLQEEEAALVALNLPAAEHETELAALRHEVTESVWPHTPASVGLTADALKQGVVPYLQVVTPYVRGATTDLNLPLGLALISFIAIQVFGVLANGPSYFLKFINLSALGNLRKKPLGAIDFIVGLLEIISELGKIVSLTFRLFGNIFAGGILLAVISFLVGLGLPIIFYGLELIVGTIQAFVFAILTIVFSAQAMEGHHGDDEHHEEAH